MKSVRDIILTANDEKLKEIAWWYLGQDKGELSERIDDLLRSWDSPKKKAAFLKLFS